MTAIPDAKLALAAMLRARPALAGVLVRAGLPAEIPVELERFYVDASIGDVEVGEHGPADESFTVHVVIETRKVTGADPAGYAVVEARKWELYRELEAGVKADPQLGVAVWGSSVVVQAEATRPTLDGWFGQVVALVRCRDVA